MNLVHLSSNGPIGCHSRSTIAGVCQCLRGPCNEEGICVSTLHGRDEPMDIKLQPVGNGTVQSDGKDITVSQSHHSYVTCCIYFRCVQDGSSIIIQQMDPMWREDWARLAMRKTWSQVEYMQNRCLEYVVFAWLNNWWVASSAVLQIEFIANCQYANKAPSRIFILRSTANDQSPGGTIHKRLWTSFLCTAGDC